MQKLLFATMLILILSGFVSSNNIKVYGPQSQQITIHGRYYLNNTSVMYDWVCFRIDFCFVNATKITWNVVDTWNIYHIVTDGNNTKQIQPQKDKQITIFQSSKQESHCIQIIKITENHYGPVASKTDSAFNGIEFKGSGSLVKTSKKYDYRFQFLGDSITAGFGVLGGSTPSCFWNMRHLQNCRQSWAVHLSKKFNAEYRLQAVSGKGVIRNAILIPGQKMPSLFTRVTDNSELNSYKYEDKYVPDVQFLFIGINDYSNIKHPTISNFVTGYKKLLQEVLNRQMIYTDSSSKIINLCNIQKDKQLCNNVKNAVKEFKYGYKHAYYVEIPQGTTAGLNVGCNFHPNVKAQNRIADSVYEQVKRILRE